MFPNSRTMLILFAAVALTACDKNDATAVQSSASTATTEPTTPAATTPTGEAPAATAANADAIGITACDDYLDKYAACIADKVPSETRATLQASLDQTRDAWRAALSSGSSKNDLEAACQTMYDSAKTAMSAYGCSDF